MSIAVRTARGALWHLGSGVGIRAVGLVGTLVLTRFLAPDQYGEVLLAAACVVTVTRSMTLGATAFVITHRTSPAEAFQAGATQLGLTIAGALFVTLLRAPIAAILGAPGMAIHVPGLALAAVVAQIAAVPTATLTRELHFKLPAVARTLGELAYVAVSLVAAPLLGATAVVLGNLARSFLSTTLLVSGASKEPWWRPCWPRWEVLRRLLSFGLPLTGNTIANTISGYGDNLLVSRFYGPGTMGFYNIGFNVATTPTAYVADHAGDVMLPGLAAVSEPARRRQAFLRALAAVSLLVLPLALGLAVTAPRLVSTLLDPRWAPVAPMITVLSGIAVARTFGSVANPYLISSRRSKTIFVLGWLRALTLLLLLVTLGRLGPIWACVSATLAAVATNAGSLVAVCRLEGVRFRQLLRAVSPAFAAGVLMVLAVLGARRVAFGDLPGPLALAGEVLVGALCYAVAVKLMAPGHVADVLRIAGDLVGRRKVSPSGEA